MCNCSYTWHNAIYTFILLRWWQPINACESQSIKMERKKNNKHCLLHSLPDLACYESFLLCDATSALTIHCKEHQFKMGIWWIPQLRWEQILFQTQMCQSEVPVLSPSLAPHPPLATVTTHINVPAEKNGRTLSNLFEVLSAKPA